MPDVGQIAHFNEPTLGEIYRLIESLKTDFTAHEVIDREGFIDQDRKRHAALDHLQPRLLMFDATLTEHTKMIAAIDANVVTLGKASVRNAILLSGALVTLLLDLVLKLT